MSTDSFNHFNLFSINYKFTQLRIDKYIKNTIQSKYLNLHTILSITTYEICSCAFSR